MDAGIEALFTRRIAVSREKRCIGTIQGVRAPTASDYEKRTIKANRQI